MFGLKQASKQWNIKSIDALVSTGFIQSKFDYSMFTNKKGDEIFIMLVYVDDLMITDNSKQTVDELNEVLIQNFRMKNLGEVRHLLGIEI